MWPLSLPHVHWGKVINRDVNIKTFLSPSTSFEWRQLIKAHPHPTRSHRSQLFVYQAFVFKRPEQGERERRSFQKMQERLTALWSHVKTRHCNLAWCCRALYQEHCQNLTAQEPKADSEHCANTHIHTCTCPLLNPDANRHYPDAAAPSEINHSLSTALPLSLSSSVCLFFPPLL